MNLERLERLERLEQLRVRAADGLSTPEERRELLASGVDVSAHMAAAERLRGVVTRALAAPPLSLPGQAPFADRVLEEVGLTDQSLRPLLLDALHGGAAPELADSVLSALSMDDGYRGARVASALQDGAGQTPELGSSVTNAVGFADASRPVGDVVRDVLDGGETPDLVGPVLAAVSAAEADGGMSVGDVVRSALNGGAAPELADDVLAALGLTIGQATGNQAAQFDEQAPPRVVAEAPTAAPRFTPVETALEASPVVVPFWPRARRWTMAAGLAAAAAAVLAVVGLPGVRLSDSSVEVAQAIHFESVNQIQIEEISTHPGAMVQVLQFEENAPAIIFIDVLEEPDGDAGSEGVPL